MRRQIFFVALLLAQASSSAVATGADDPSMLLWGSSHRELATRAVALSMAAMIFKDVYGEADFRTQLPLHITDAGDRWIVEGSRRPEDHASPKGEASFGKAEIEILKANCQVVKLTEKAFLSNGK